MCCGPRTAKGDRLYAKLALVVDDPSQIDDELRIELAELRSDYIRWAESADERARWEEADITDVRVQHVLARSLFRMLSNARSQVAPS